jgi:hypothetical protein
MNTNNKPAKFPLGQIVGTPASLQAIQDAQQTPLEFLSRHQQRDWGEVGKEDWDANDAALVEGTRLLSAYRTRQNVRIWVITEWDRSVTTILLPDEY